MPDESTLLIVRALARGVDPLTGAALPTDHVCQQPPTVRALCAVLAELDAPPGGAATRRAVPAGGKAGAPWNADEDAALIQAFDQGATLGALAREHQRSRGAIEARLVRLGKLTAPPGYRFAGTPQDGAAPPSAKRGQQTD